MRKKLSAFKVLVIIICVAVMHAGLTVYARTATTAKIDAVLVHDVSGSMFKSDPNEISLDAMKMFIDLCDYGMVEVGAVTFSDTIIGERELIPLDTIKDKADLKNYLNAMKFTNGNTDIGLALKTAAGILDKNPNSDHSRIIVLFTDGKTALDGSTGRVSADSKKDVHEVIDKAVTQGFQIYCIGLNYDGTVDRDELTMIAKSTGGFYEETKSAENLPEILRNIFAKHNGVTNRQIDEYKADGTLNSHIISIPDSTVLAANIIVTAGGGVSEAHIIDPQGLEYPIPSEKIIYSSGLVYSIYKIMQPDKGDWTFQIKAVPDDSVKIDLIMSRDFTLNLTASVNGDGKLEMISYLCDRDSRNIDDWEIYETSKVTASVSDKLTGDTKKIDMSLENGEFRAVTDYDGSSEYTVIAQLTNGNLDFYSDMIEISTPTAKPDQTSKPEPTAQKILAAKPETEESVNKEETGFVTKILSSVWFLIVGGIAFAAIIAVAVLIILKRLKPLKFSYGKLSVSASGVAIPVPPVVWDFEAKSYNKKEQALVEILDAMCQKTGGSCESIMNVKTAGQIKFKPHKTGNLIVTGINSSIGVVNADPAGTEAYFIPPRTNISLYLEEGGTLQIKYLD